MGIPQGSPISPILYLFYNADLLDECYDISISTDPIGFVDDINILTYSKSLERNCKNLEKVYQKCQNWATSHGSKFNPKKFELIHFTRKREALGKAITLEGVTIPPSKDIKILGVFLNSGLTATAHLETLQKRVPALLGALKSITKSTWGLSLQTGRDLYLKAIRPALSYGATAWFPLEKEAKALRGKLNAIQGRFLRSITGAYRATSTEALEIETFTEPLDLFIERTANLGLIRQVQRGLGNEIKLFSQRIIERTRRGARKQNLSFERALTTLEGRLRVNKDLSKKEKGQEDPLKRYKRALEAFYAIKWRKRWLKSQKGRAIARYRPYPTKEALELYKDRAKAHCSILIQLRTEKIGLKAFLKGRRVPGYEDSTCECQEEEETVQHFLLRCQRWRTQREEILGTRAKTNGVYSRNKNHKPKGDRIPPLYKEIRAIPGNSLHHYTIVL